MVAANAYGFSSYGIDLDDYSLTVARKRGLNVECIGFEDFFRRPAREPFQTITLFEVLEHQCNPLSLLLGAAAHLDAGGVIAGTVPNRDRFKFLGRPDAYDFPPHHFLWFDTASLRATLIAAGFQDVTISVEMFGFRTDEVIHGLGSRVKPLLHRRPRKPSDKGLATSGTLQRGKIFNTARWAGRLVSRPVSLVEQIIERRLGQGGSLFFHARKRGSISQPASQ
jgi:hypothetical protein